MDYRPPGSSVHGIFQARVLEWGALAFSAFKPMHMLKKKKSLKHRCFYDYTVTKMAKIRSVILSVGKDLSYITDGSVKWCGSFGKLGFPGGSDGKESACNAGDLGSIPGFGRSPRQGKGYPFQYSWASLAAQMVKKPPEMWETWVRSLGLEDPLQEGMATHSSILAWSIPMDRGAWWATVHGVAKSWTLLSN